MSSDLQTLRVATAAAAAAAVLQQIGIWTIRKVFHSIPAPKGLVDVLEDHRVSQRLTLVGNLFGLGAIAVCYCPFLVHFYTVQRARKAVLERKLLRPAMLNDASDMFESCKLTFVGTDNAHLLDNGVRCKRFCLKCNHDLEYYRLNGTEHYATAGSRVCDVQVPNACLACSFEPEKAGFSLVQFYLTAEQYHSYIGMRAAKHTSDKKSIHAALTVMCEGRNHSNFDMQKEMMLDFCGIISQLQQAILAPALDNIFTRHLYWYSFTLALKVFAHLGQRYAFHFLFQLLPTHPVTGHRYATEWRNVIMPQNPRAEANIGPEPEAVAARPDPTAEELGRIRQCLAAAERQVDEHDGQVGMRIVTELTPDDLENLAGLQCGGELPRPRPLSEIIAGTRCVLPGWREDMQVTFAPHCTCAGPLIANPVVWNNRDDITKAAAATVRVIQPGTWKLDDQSTLRNETAEQKRLHKQARWIFQRNYKKYWRTVRKILYNEAAILKFVSKTPLFCALNSGKVTAEEFVRLLNEMRVKASLRPFTGNVKLEVTCKPGKSPRIVFDAGLERSIVETLVAYVFDHLLFEHCGPASIKGKARNDRLDEITTELSEGGEDCIFVELDQTGFDGHNRMYERVDSGYAMNEGTTVGFYYELCSLYDHVARCIGKSANDTWRMLQVSLGDAEKPETQIRFNGSTRGDRCGRWKAMVQEQYMFSGRKITSSGNFLCELGIDLCCNVGNPEAVFENDLKTWNWQFKGFWHGQAKNKEMVHYRTFLEGDDQLARCSRAISAHAPVAAWLYEDAGFEVKRVVLDGVNVLQRAEFVGVHIAVQAGKTTPGRWVPDVARGLINSGVYIGTPGEDPRVHAANKAMSLLSRAIFFAKRCAPAAAYLRSLARDWAVQAGLDALARARVYGYKAECWGYDDLAYDALSKYYEREEREAWCVSDQIVMLSCSLQREVSVSDFARFSGNAPGVRVNTPAIEVHAWLPEPFRVKCASTL